MKIKHKTQLLLWFGSTGSLASSYIEVFSWGRAKAPPFLVWLCLPVVVGPMAVEDGRHNLYLMPQLELTSSLSIHY